MSINFSPVRLQPAQLKNPDKAHTDTNTDTNTDVASSDANYRDLQSTGLSPGIAKAENNLNSRGDSLLFQQEAKMQRSDVVGLSDDIAGLSNGLSAGLSPFPPGVFDSPVVALTQQEARLEEQLANTVSIFGKIKLVVQLLGVRNQLHQEALKALEKFMVSEQSLLGLENDPSFRPGLGGEPGDLIGIDEMSLDELRALAANPSAATEVRASAQYLLDKPSVLNSVMMAASRQPPSTTAGDPGITDNSISLADIQASRLQAGNLPNQIEQNISAPGGSYSVPDKDDNGIPSTANNPGKGQLLFNSQQEAVEQAIKTGESVEFVNQDGETIKLVIIQLNGPGGASYHVSLNGGEDHVRVDSEWSTEDTISGIANIIDWGSTFGAAESVPSFPQSVIFASRNHDPDPNAPQASVVGDGDMIFFGGESLNRVVYNHEQAHVIGIELSTRQTHYATPEGWAEVVNEAAENGIHRVSQYAYRSPAESFAESVAAYVNARNNGPEALAQFKAAYPYRSAFIEEHVLTS